MSRRKLPECQIILKGKENRKLHRWPGRDTRLLASLTERVDFGPAAGVGQIGLADPGSKNTGMGHAGL